MIKSDLPMDNDILLTTTTGEIIQPIRLHYEIFDKAEVHRCGQSPV